jgi:predicted metalloprotease
MSRIRLIVTGIVVAAALMGAFAPKAHAVSPNQTTETGLVNLLISNQYGTIDDFWRRTLPGWGFTYYAPHQVIFYGGSFGESTTGCSPTWDLPRNGFYCSADQKVWLDYWFMQGLLNQYGDYHPGAFLAHEWGHRIQHHLGMWYLQQGYRTEYNADCLAGLYTRYGYAAGRLVGNDYWEGYYWLYNQPASVSHGVGATRAAWYQYGYTQYTKAACDAVFSSTTGVSSASGSGVARRSELGLPDGFVDSRPPTSKRRVDLSPAGGTVTPALGRSAITLPSAAVEGLTPAVGRPHADPAT